MAKNQRLTPNRLAELKASFAGLKNIADYKPVKPEYSVAEIQLIETTINELTVQEAQILAQLGEVRDRIAESGTTFAQKMKGAAQQVIAQFGDDSPQVQAVGRKRSSERAAPKRKPNPESK